MAGTVVHDAQRKRHAAGEQCCVESAPSASGVRPMLTITAPSQPVRGGGSVALAFLPPLLSSCRGAPSPAAHPEISPVRVITVANRAVGE